MCTFSSTSASNLNMDRADLEAILRLVFLKSKDFLLLTEKGGRTGLGRNDNPILLFAAGFLFISFFFFPCPSSSACLLLLAAAGNYSGSGSTATNSSPPSFLHFFYLGFF